MNWNPTRVLPYFAIAVGSIVACSRPALNDNLAAPAPARVPPSTVRADVSRQQATSLDQLLAGRISGVTVSPAPGGGIVVRIGGPTSFYGSQSPLFVVDGVPLEVSGGTLSWLDPHDIEVIQALKDPSQTAMYGIRGANGVIVIRTKGSH
jgi:TonB-dependent SusC/RagA subfamily outer membrane receptor